MSAGLNQEVLAVLDRRHPKGAFVTELVFTIDPSAGPSQIEGALAELERSGRVVIIDHVAPDIHLKSTDLRIVAQVPPEEDYSAAYQIVEALWEEWLRSFLATHRCQ